MKTTTQQCFKSAYALYVWQERNCQKCKKAVCYNQKTGKMPQYRCAVQRQIEGQQLGDVEINQRTFDAVQESKCKYFVTDVEQPEILNFSKGESLVTAGVYLATATKPQPVIQDKKPKEKIHDATLMRMAMESGISLNALEEAEKRMFETIKKNGFLPPTSLDEARFRQQMRNDTQKMLDTFTWQENMMIAFVPLIISRIAWWYAEKVMKYCADHRIQEVKKLGRSIKDLRQRYIDDLRKDLDLKHINNVETQAMKFIDECSRDFQLLWFQVNGAIKNEYPDMPYSDMRTDAWCGVLMVDFLKRHNADMDKVIAAKMGQSTSITNPHMVSLATLLDAYLPQGFILKDERRQIGLCIRVLANRIRTIDFELTD